MPHELDNDIVNRLEIKNLSSSILRRLLEKVEERERREEYEKQDACNHNFRVDESFFCTICTCKKCGYSECDM